MYLWPLSPKPCRGALLSVTGNPLLWFEPFVTSSSADSSVLWLADFLHAVDFPLLYSCPTGSRAPLPGLCVPSTGEFMIRCTGYTEGNVSISTAPSLYKLKLQNCSFTEKLSGQAIDLKFLNWSSIFNLLVCTKRCAIFALNNLIP